MTFLGGVFDAEVVQQIVTHFQQTGEVCFANRPVSDQSVFLPANIDGLVNRIEFSMRESRNSGLQNLLESLPSHYSMRQMDQDLFSKCVWRDIHIKCCGSEEAFLNNALGYCLLNKKEIVCEAYAVFWGVGKVEIGVITHDEFRGQGFATLTCAHLADVCEQRGYSTYWACDEENLASVAVARKLGYTREQKYILTCYSSTEKSVER